MMKFLPLLVLPLQVCLGEVSPEADKLVKAMSEKLASAEAIQFSGTRLTRLPAEEGKKDQTDNKDEKAGEKNRKIPPTQFSILLSRPNLLKTSSKVKGEVVSEFYCDGTQVTIHSVRQKIYAVEPVKAESIEDVLDYLQETFDVDPPLSDFLVTNIHEILVTDATSGKMLPDETIKGVKCKVVEFELEGIKWKMAIAEETKLPKRYEVEFSDQEGVEKFSATFRKWNLKPKAGPEVFKFTPPDEAIKTGMIPMPKDEKKPAGKPLPEEK